MDEELTSLLLLLLFQTNAEQQTKIQDLQEKLSKVDWICICCLPLWRRLLADNICTLATNTRV